jgi:hypothetical protein
VTRVVFLLVPHLHLLDLAGPAQAFATAADFGCGYELSYVGEREDVPTAQGLTLRAVTGWPELGRDDLVIVPGWRAAPALAGTGPLAEATLAAIAAHHANGGGRQRLRRGRRPRPGRAARRPPLHYPPRHPGRARAALPAGMRCPRRALRHRRAGGHLGGHRQRHRPGAAPDRRP